MPSGIGEAGCSELHSCLHFAQRLALVHGISAQTLSCVPVGHPAKRQATRHLLQGHTSGAACKGSPLMPARQLYSDVVIASGARRSAGGHHLSLGQRE